MMQQHEMFFAVLAVLVLSLCLISAWARRGRLIRWGLLTLGVAIIGGSYPVMNLLLSHPRDAAEEWLHKDAKEALVTGVYVDEGTALYLYLMLPGSHEPGSYKFAWNDETQKLAQDVQKSLQSEEGGNGVVIPLPFQPSEEREKPLTAMPLPQTAPPLKQQPKAPMEYRAIKADPFWPKASDFWWIWA